MNARGDIFPLISWLGLVLIALIVGYWFFSHFFVGKNVLERMENDLQSIRAMVDDACDTAYYKATYNPFIEQGSLDANKTHICIRTGDINKCRTVLCDKLPEYKIMIDLSTITELVVVKERGSDVVEVKGLEFGG